MGTRAPPFLLLLLLLGCWAQGPGGTSGPPPSLWSLADQWVPDNVTTLRLRCQRTMTGTRTSFRLLWGPGPPEATPGPPEATTGPVGATPGPLGATSGPPEATPGPLGATPWPLGAPPELVQDIASTKDFVIFDVPPVTGVYVCHCGDPPGPPSNSVEVVVTDHRLPPPRLWLPPLQALPAPPHATLSLLCGGPPGAATFRLYRGGPGGRVGQQWVRGGGGPARFALGPLAPPHEGAYVCTYSPPGGGVSMPSPRLMLLLQNGTAAPTDPNWPGCEHWRGNQ